MKRYIGILRVNHIAELSAPPSSHGNNINYVGEIVTTIWPNNTVYFQARRTF